MAHDSIRSVSPQSGRVHLIYRIAGHDRSALKCLYDDIGPKLFALLIRATADRETAERLLVETFVGIWRTAHLFTAEPTNPDTWLFKVARSTALNFMNLDKVS